jgi:hypothetical protein
LTGPRLALSAGSGEVVVAREVVQGDSAYIDFQGGITTEEVRKFLRDDDSRDARALLSKLIDDAGVEDLMVTVADCLKEHIRSGINEGIVRTQLITYSDS